MKTSAELQMPNNYVEMGTEEMEYLDGGLTLSYNWSYRTKAGAAAKALSLKISKGWWRISTYDLGAEIFTHAAAYYGGVYAITRALGYLGWSKCQSIANSLRNGIDVENGLDTAKVAGISRYWVYRTVYAFYPSRI